MSIVPSPDERTAEQVYTDAKAAAERAYAQDLAEIVHLRGGETVRERARKAAGDRLNAAYQAAWLAYTTATAGTPQPLGPGLSGPGTPDGGAL